MKKNIVTLGVIIILFVFPAIAWFALYSGLEYRKQLISELKPQDTLDFLVNNYLIKDRTVVLSLDKSANQILDKLDDQFKDELYFVGIGYELDHHDQNKHQFDANTIDSLRLLYKNTSIILVDSTGVIRNRYGDISKKTSKELVKHLTVLMPIKKNKGR